jgi:hypothetical protein
MAHKPKPPKPATAYQFAMAARMARKYLDIGLSQYNGFAASIRPGPSSGGLIGLTKEHVPDALSAAMILSFTVELYTKVLCAQRLHIFPQSHEIDVLMEYLPEDVQLSIASRYEKLLEGNRTLLAFEIASGESPEFPGGAAGRGTFTEAVVSISRLFVYLRYIHEELTTDFYVRLDFHQLILMAQALVDEMDSLKEGVQVNF